MSWALSSSHAQTDGPVLDAKYEYSLKAQYLERFIRFIEWPEGSLPENDGAFIITVIGENPFDPYLKRMARERRIKDRDVEVWIVDHIAQIGDSQVLFIAKTETKNLEKILESVADQSTLTISEIPGSAEQGVHINFFEQDGHIRFEVNVSSMRAVGLDPSSKLLRLARIVDPK